MSQSIGIFLSLILWVICFMETTSFSITMMASGNTNTNANANTRTKPSQRTAKNRPKQRKKSKPGSMHKTRNNHNVANHDTEPQPKPKKIHTIEELSKMSIAQAIVESTSSKHLLHTSTRLWLPTDDDLPSHLRTQAIHHEKRIKAASQLLKRLGDCIGNERGVAFDAQLWNEAGENGFKHAILASFIPFHGDLSPGYMNMEIKNTCIALMGLHAIVGFTLPNSSSRDITLDPHILEAIKSLIQRADLMTPNLEMHEAVEVRWAIRGIISRIGSPLSNLISENEIQDDCIDGEDSPRVLKRAIPNLEERVAKLPFDIIPSCLDWNSFDGEESTLKSLLSEIPFNVDTITTRTGSKVEERRGTAWVADEGIGSLAYSGKLMASHVLPPIVSEAMRRVEQGILAHDPHEQLEICCQEIGNYFDCALCNHYPNGESACKFHTDPEHGTYWERLTCVVSAGDDDVRKFAFRPIPDLNEWDKFETKKLQKDTGHQNDDNGNGIIPAVIPLFPGDVVKMDSECNDLFHHAVYNRQDVRVGTNELVKNSDGRVSLVFKRAMDRGSGRKGHGKAGEGRRSRRF